MSKKKPVVVLYKFLSALGRVKTRFSRAWVSLSRRQRWALAVLGAANLVVLVGLVALLARGPSPDAGLPQTSPLSPQRLDACSQRVSRALLDAGQSGIVQIQDDTALLQLQRSTLTTSLRLDADAATWAALEAMGIAGGGDCLGLDVLEVVVELYIPDTEPLRATTRVGLADLWLWSLSEIDDAELARRLDYQPPLTSTLVLP